MTPKADGSLFNCTCIVEGNQAYEFAMAMILEGNLPPKSYYVAPDSMIVIMGSKGTIFSKNPVNDRIHEAVEATYGSIELFIDVLMSSIGKGIANCTFDPIRSIITFHFEAISKKPTKELTVIYDKAMARFLGTTIGGIDGDVTKFLIPDCDNIFDFKCLTSVKEFTTFHEMMEHFKSVYDGILDGDNDLEPEGWVIWVQQVDDSWIAIKYKYDFYYAAHKPDSKHNQVMTTKLMEDPKYTKLRYRLVHFAEKISIDNILMSETVKVSLNRLCELLIAFTKADESPDIGILKKDWVSMCRPQIIPALEIITSIFEQIGEHYPHFNGQANEKKVNAFFMRIHQDLHIGDNKHDILNFQSTIAMIIKQFFFS